MKRRIEEGVWLLAAACLQCAALMGSAVHAAAQTSAAVPTETEALQTLSDKLLHLCRIYHSPQHGLFRLF